MIENKSILSIPIDLIVPEAKQPRQYLDPAKLEELKNSIAKHSVLVPIAVMKQANGKYLLIDGERRYRASKALKLKDIPAIVHSAQDFSKAQVKRYHIQERTLGWTGLDKAQMLFQMLENIDNTEERKQLAEDLGMNMKTLSEYMSL